MSFQIDKDVKRFYRQFLVIIKRPTPCADVQTSPSAIQEAFDATMWMKTQNMAIQNVKKESGIFTMVRVIC